MRFTSAMDEELSSKSAAMVSSICSCCHGALGIPWIRCAKCVPKHDICATCFSFGIEFESHESDHPYTVVKYDFPIYEASWTASEELQLLDAIQEYGLGNWTPISKRLRTKSASDCERHYFHCYIDNPQYPLPEFPEPESMDGGAPVIFKLSDYPPRPAEGTRQWVHMGGYNAARSDFNVEYNNCIEMDVCQLSNNYNWREQQGESEEEEPVESLPADSDKKFYEDLNLAVIQVYRNCLKERFRRKKIVRDYGLINFRGIMRPCIEGSLPLTVLRPFMRLFPPITFDKYLESLSYEKKLQMDISLLQGYRSHGITKLHSAKSFHMMNMRREMTKSQRHMLTDALNHIENEMSCRSWLARQAMSLQGSTGAGIGAFKMTRRVAQRLVIEGMPGFEQLNDAEKQLCSEIRLVPQAYLDFSKILISEYDKIGYLRLGQARSLIKIDVNKTRKLYNFLLQQGTIAKDSKMVQSTLLNSMSMGDQ